MVGGRRYEWTQAYWGRARALDRGRQSARVLTETRTWAVVGCSARSRAGTPTGSRGCSRSAGSGVIPVNPHVRSRCWASAATRASPRSQTSRKRGRRGRHLPPGRSRPASHVDEAIAAGARGGLDAARRDRRGGGSAGARGGPARRHEPLPGASSCRGSRREGRGGPSRDTPASRAGELPALARATVHRYVDASPAPSTTSAVRTRSGSRPSGCWASSMAATRCCSPPGREPPPRSSWRCCRPGRHGGGRRRRVLGDGGADRRTELARWGLNVVAFDQTGEPPNADLVWLEPCANPMMSFPDLDAAIGQAHAAGALVVVDNTVLSPVLLRPLEHGADFVLHSASEDPGRPPRRAARRGRAARGPRTTSACAAFRAASGIVAAPDPGLAAAPGAEDARAAGGAPVGERPRAGPPAEPSTPPCTGSAIPGSARIRSRRGTSTRSGRCCRSTWPTRTRPRSVERLAEADRERHQPGRRGLDARGPGALGTRPACRRGCCG